MTVKKSPSLGLSILFFNVDNEKGVLGAAQRPPFACSLLQGLALFMRKTLQKRTSERRSLGRPKHTFLIVNVGEKYTER